MLGKRPRLAASVLSRLRLRGVLGGRPVERIDGGAAVGLVPGAVGAHGEADVRVPELAADVVHVRPGLEGRVGVPEAMGEKPGRSSVVSFAALQMRRNASRTP